MIVNVTVVGAREIARRWLAKVAAVDAEVDVDLEQHAQMLKSQIQGRAPVRTGRYRASWQVERQGKGQRVVASGEPYGQRLEHGFFGVDALGRHYSQAPQPHVNPSADVVEGQFAGAVADTVVRGL